MLGPQLINDSERIHRLIWYWDSKPEREPVKMKEMSEKHGRFRAFELKKRVVERRVCRFVVNRSGEADIVYGDRNI